MDQSHSTFTRNTIVFCIYIENAPFELLVQYSCAYSWFLSQRQGATLLFSNTLLVLLTKRKSILTRVPTPAIIQRRFGIYSIATRYLFLVSCVLPLASNLDCFLSQCPLTTTFWTRKYLRYPSNTFTRFLQEVLLEGLSVPYAPASHKLRIKESNLASLYFRECQHTHHKFILAICTPWLCNDPSLTCKSVALIGVHYLSATSGSIFYRKQ